MTTSLAPRDGGAVTVRSFIPHRAHASIGVLGAVSVATACLIEGSPAAEVASIPSGNRKTLSKNETWRNWFEWIDKHNCTVVDNTKFF